MKAIEKLTSGLQTLGFNPSPSQINALLQFIELVIAYNQEVNLTAITSIDDAIDLHLLDSLTLKPWLDALPPTASILDIGCGAGIPSIPIAIMYPEFRLTLLDARNKKILACKSFIKALGLSHIHAYHGRIEQWSGDGVYDLLLSRAVTQCRQMLQWVSHLQYKQLLIMKGQHPTAELAAIHNKSYTITQVHIPLRDEKRHIVVF